MGDLLTGTATQRPRAEVGDRRLALLWVAAAGVVLLHNAEEWLLDMTGWIAGQAWIPGHALHGDQSEFALVLAIVTFAVWAIAAVAVLARPRWSAEVLVCIGYALAVNGVSHVVLSLVSQSLMPGAITAVTVLVPFGVLVIRALPTVPWTISSVATTIIAVVGITAGAFALAALLTGTA